MRFDQLPVIRWPEGEKKIAQEVRSAVQLEGRTARCVGLSASACPNFKDNDMRIDWQLGWRWEDEDIRARKQVAGLTLFAPKPVRRYSKAKIKPPRG